MSKTLLSTKHWTLFFFFLFCCSRLDQIKQERYRLLKIFEIKYKIVIEAAGLTSHATPNKAKTVVFETYFISL